MNEAAAQVEARVRTRRVHYISGFDPRGSRHYHRLYREEAEKQTPHLGTSLQIGSREKMDDQVSAWQIEAEWKGQAVSTEYQFMGWDDLVRRYWVKSLAQLLWRALLTYVPFSAAGGFRRTRNSARNAYLSAVYPLVFLFLVVLVAGLLGTIAGWITAALSGSLLVGLLTGGILAAAVLVMGRSFADKIGVLWLLRTSVFIYYWGTHDLKDLTERAREMAKRIVEAQRSRPVDEVLIVGHSVGSMLAVPVAAEIVRKYPESAGEMHLLTLGQCIPYLSYIRAADWFRAELQTLADNDTLRWTDVTAPPDPLCFFQVDPFEVCQNQPRPEKYRQVVARVFKMFHKATYQKIRRNKLRIHFQYLMASELPSDYDYFKITAGPGFLEENLAVPAAT